MKASYACQNSLIRLLTVSIRHRRSFRDGPPVIGLGMHPISVAAPKRPIAVAYAASP